MSDVKGERAALAALCATDKQTEEQRDAVAAKAEKQAAAEKRRKNRTRRYVGTIPRLSRRAHEKSKRNPTKRCPCGSGHQFWRCCRGQRVDL